jgi:hypothetical protein
MSQIKETFKVSRGPSRPRYNKNLSSARKRKLEQKSQKELNLLESLKNPIPKANRRLPNRKNRNNAMKQLARSASEANLTSRELAVARQYVDNFLYPTKPFKLVRPIPVRSYSFFKEGEILFDDVDSYSEIQMQPDPWHFIRIKRRTASSVVSFNQEYTTSYTNAGQTTFTPTSTHRIGLCSNLSTTTDQIIECQNRVFSAGGVLVYTNFNGHVENGSCGYYGLDTTGTITLSFTSYSEYSVGVAVDLYVVNPDETLAYTLLNAATVSLPARGSVTKASETFTYTVSSDQFLMITGRIYNPGPNNVFLKDFTISLVGSSAPLSTEATITSDEYTLGRALYPNDVQSQEVVMDLFNGSQLWGPVAMAALLNVTQELQSAGGKFKAAYLPSFIQDKLPLDFQEEWSQISSYKASYPVFEGPYAKGVQATWVGQRIEDYQFRKPFNSEGANEFEAKSFPLDVFMANKASTTSSAKYFLQFSVVFELQTTNPLCTMTLGPSSTNLLPQMLAHAVASDHLIGENPSHVERLKKLALKIMSDPVVRQSFKALAGAGLAALLP